MNIKFAAYATAAVLVGFTVMMLPLALETGPPTYDPTQAPSAYTSPLSEGRNEPPSWLPKTDGFSSQPYNIAASSLILLAGLVIALTAYILFKRQLRQQPTTFSS